MDEQAGMVFVEFDQGERDAVDVVVRGFDAIGDIWATTSRQIKLRRRAYVAQAERLRVACEGPALRYLTRELGTDPEPGHVRSLAAILAGAVLEQQLPGFHIVLSNPEDN